MGEPGFEVASHTLHADAARWVAWADRLERAAAPLSEAALTAHDLTVYSEVLLGLPAKYEELRLRAIEVTLQGVAAFHQIAAALRGVAQQYDAADEESRRRLVMEA